jgi:hypothetical protein
MGALQLNDCGCQRSFTGCTCDSLRAPGGNRTHVAALRRRSLSRWTTSASCSSAARRYGIGGIRTLTVQIKSLLCCRYTTTPSGRLWVCVSIDAEWSCQISEIVVQQKKPGVVCDTGLCVFDRDGPSGVTGAGDTAGQWPIDWRPDRCCSVCLINRTTGPSLLLFPLLLFNLRLAVGSGTMLRVQRGRRRQVPFSSREFWFFRIGPRGDVRFVP